MVISETEGISLEVLLVFRGNYTAFYGRSDIMIKFKQGSVGNINTGETVDIVVKSWSPNSLRDILIGGAIVISGIAYLTVSAFKNGCCKMEEAEFTALTKAGCVKNLPEQN
jgi:hypothetical protein